MDEGDVIEDESEISDFEMDDEIKEGLNSLMKLEFINGSSEDEAEDNKKPEETEKGEERRRGDSLEREMEMMFTSQHVNTSSVAEAASKDTGLESISENELDGPESGECDTSDGELPDSPNIVVTVPDTPPLGHVQGVEDLSGSSDVELVEDFQGRGREHSETLTQKVSREVIVETSDSSPKKKERSPSKSKDKSPEKVKRDKKDRGKKKNEIEGVDEKTKRRLKLEKYMARLELYKAKCRSYINQLEKKCDIIKTSEKTKVRVENNKIRSSVVESKLKSIVAEVNRDVSPPSSTSSKFDQGSRSSKTDKSSHTSVSNERGRRRSASSEKERKSKHKKSKSKSKELKEHKFLYQKYLQYLQLERTKCFEEGLALNEKHKKQKKKRIKSKGHEKKEEPVVTTFRPILSFAEFCNNRELVSPDRDIPKPHTDAPAINIEAEARSERKISIDSAATTATVRSSLVDPTDDDKELFITYSDLVQQDKLNKEKTTLELEKEKIETELEKDPELKSISVFTSVLFKGGADSECIPFLSSEGRPPSPKAAEAAKPKKPFIQDTGIDEIYDINDLSNISQSSLSPSRSPVPKLHNKALLNYLENQKEREEIANKKYSEKSSKSSRSRSKSPRRQKSKSKKRKRKHHSSISTMSPSPPPLRPRSPENLHRKRPSPPAYLKERWKDYPSPPDRRLARREHKPPRSRRRSRSRSRKVHRSRSSSEERHHRRYRSQSRSRSPPVLTMVQLTASERRRKLKDDHERALASLRETIRKPPTNTPLSITITNRGENFEGVRDNYDPVVMNEVRVPGGLKTTKERLLPTYTHYHWQAFHSNTPIHTPLMAPPLPIRPRPLAPPYPLCRPPYFNSSYMFYY